MNNNIKELKETISLDNVKHYENNFDNAVDYMANFLDSHNVVAIKLLEFPSWEDVVEKDICNVTHIMGEFHSYIQFIKTPSVLTIYANYYVGDFDKQNKSIFNYSEQGYNQAIQWMENERIKLIKELCGVE